MTPGTDWDSTVNLRLPVRVRTQTGHAQILSR